MLIVTDTKVRNIKMNWAKINKYDPMPVFRTIGEEEPFVAIKTELVLGRRFASPNGLRYTIGWDKETQLALGLPFRIFKSMEKRRESDYKENTRLRRELREINEMTFLRKLRFVFNI